MRLYYSRNSPYARIARMAVVEWEIAPVEQIEVVTRAPDNPLLKVSPTARVPCLVDGERVIGEARTICAYLQSMDADHRSTADWDRIAFESTLTGFLDGLAVWIRETRRPEDYRSSAVIEHERAKTLRCLEWLDGRVASPRGTALDFGDMTLVSALHVMEFNRLVPDWQSGHPVLGNWLDQLEGRPSVSTTQPR
ncbi:glutathione S-transferase family protein [Pararhizobium mangrovi]|uniref:Glutathione S-transferase family protein n=1 Tax=Pararhizobium mangrovi TaxID=2590452 RepID=A0A506UD45_9HYPH|nr:glutathione S-transferase family protein [Pararhizobium mangrovi]TPW30715.1 glutathione S-transferase family protein [Pararhizobium mangrovi]